MQKFNGEIVSLLELRNLEHFVYSKGGRIIDVINNTKSYEVIYSLPNEGESK